MLVSLGRMKKKIPELDEQKIVSKIQFTNEVKPASTENLLIVEAVPELLDLKQKLFQNLSSEFGNYKSVILATNTSSLPVKEIGLHVQNKSSFAGSHFIDTCVEQTSLIFLIFLIVSGLHFFSPVPMMKYAFIFSFKMLFLKILTFSSSKTRIIDWSRLSKQMKQRMKQLRH